MQSAVVAAIIRASNFRRIMAGHSKWATVQRRLGAQDARRGKIFSKLIREISVATRVGGADPGANPRLRVAMDRARALSFPRDAIDQAVKHAAAESGVDAALVNVRYEGYGPGGAALMVDCLTADRSRTVAEVRHVFAEYGGHLGADGSVAYLFNQVGHMIYAPGTDLDHLMAVALQAGAEDVLQNEDSSLEVLTDPLDFVTVRAQLEADGFPPALSEITQRASTTAALDGEAALSMARLLDRLEDLDDVLSVYSNAEIPNEVLARV
jgi:YebC/PmpR family DNA-binding regulatory protein